MGHPAEHVHGEELGAIKAAGAAVWAAMEKVVDANPFYNNTPSIERGACIARLCVQALADAVVENIDGPRPQTYALVSGMARTLGQVIYCQGGLVDAAEAERLLRMEMAVAVRDLELLLTPKGVA